MTDEGILLEYYLDQEYQKQTNEALKHTKPHCNECDYYGAPFPGSTMCPKCGEQLEMPGEDSYGDDLESGLQELGTELNEEEKKKLGID